MVEIKCLLCNKPIKLPKYIDTEDYDGEVVCQECKSLLYIRLLKSKVKKYKFKEAGFRKKYGELLGAGEVLRVLQVVAEHKKLQEGKQMGSKGRKNTKKPKQNKEKKEKKK